jgi:DNA-binding NarL/FixJ family response regulator
MSGLTVLVVDDHPLWRATVGQVLEAASDVAGVVQAGDGDEAVGHALAVSPDVVVMDLHLPGKSGIDATREILTARPGTRVLVLSSSDDETEVLEAVRSGASGYVLKTAGAAEIVQAVRLVAAGEVVFPGNVSRKLLGGLRRSEPDPLDGLSEREREVLVLMADGLSNQELAQRLFVTVKTIEAHVGAIFSKLGLEGGEGHRRMQAVVMYLKSSTPAKRSG